MDGTLRFDSSLPLWTSSLVRPMLHIVYYLHNPHPPRLVAFWVRSFVVPTLGVVGLSVSPLGSYHILLQFLPPSHIVHDPY